MTPESTHRALYSHRLSRHFDVAFHEALPAEARADVIVVDLPSVPSSSDLAALARVEVPLVVLSCDDLSELEGPGRRILVYPVSPDRVVAAVSELCEAQAEGGSETETRAD